MLARLLVLLTGLGRKNAKELEKNREREFRMAVEEGNQRKDRGVMVQECALKPGACSCNHASCCIPVVPPTAWCHLAMSSQPDSCHERRMTDLTEGRVGPLLIASRSLRSGLQADTA